MLLVSIIVRTTGITDQTKLEKVLQPKDGSRILLRRFGTSICVCMRPNGTVTTERFINLTVSDDCEWHLRISRHGLGFEHHIGADDDSSDLASSSSNTMRIATLSVTDSVTKRIASGWLHRIGEPEARWQVSSFSSTLRRMTEEIYKQNKSNLLKSPGSLNLPALPNSSELLTTPSSQMKNSTDTRQSMRVGKQEVISSGAQIHHLELLLLNAQQQHCEKLRSSILKLVLKEISYSLNAMDEFRNAFHKLIHLLKQSPPNKLLLKQNNLNLTFHTIGQLLDEWLRRKNQRWRLRINRLNKMDHINFVPSSPYSLSILNMGEKQIVPNDNPLDRLIERRSLDRIYHDLFQIIQHLAKWNSVEKLQWLKKPRLVGLFRAVGIRIPSPRKLRIAMFLLTQYLPKLMPNSKNYSTNHSNLDYGMNGRFDSQMLYTTINGNVRFKAVISRAIFMKFEQVRFWSTRIMNKMHFPNHRLTLEYEKIEQEIRMLDNQSKCYQSFLERWENYRHQDLSKLSLSTS